MLLFLVSSLALSSILFLVSMPHNDDHQSVTHAQITPTGTNSSSALNEVDDPTVSHKYSSSDDGDFLGADGSFKVAGNETQGLEDDLPLNGIGHQGSLLEEIFHNVTEDLNESGIWDMGF